MRMSMKTSKYARVRDALADAIRNGEYGSGQKLPGERALAVQYGISYMTARRAVGELVDRGLLDRRPWEGVFVTWTQSGDHLSPAPQTAVTTLNIITVGHEA